MAISGTVIVEASENMTGDQSLYFLDEDSDGEADFQLQFKEQNSDISPPEDGAVVRVTGTTVGESKDGLPVIWVRAIEKAESSGSDGGGLY